jgi:hypothetical protein
MMNIYKQLKDQQQQEINNFPMFFAFSNKQFSEGMKKLGLEPTETDKIYKIGGTGGFYKKEDSKKLHDMFDRHDKEMKEAMSSNDEFLIYMFYYELNNHEYIITYEVEDTLNALGLTYEEIKNDNRLYRALKEAKRMILESYNN